MIVASAVWFIVQLLDRIESLEAREESAATGTVIIPAPGGNRVIFQVKGGTFEGPHLRGRVVPDSGADWVRIRPDGTGVLPRCHGA